MFKIFLLLTLSMLFASLGFGVEMITHKDIDFNNVATESEDFTIWIALFGLGAVGLIGLFLSSEQLSRLKKKSKDDADSKSDLNRRQDQMLSSMSENIQHIAKETVTLAKNRDIDSVVSSENKLLSVTTNLIEFLRIKSRKIEIAEENFNLSNLLNDVTGTLRTSRREIELDLIYDVDSSIAEILRGDTLNLSKILLNTLLFCVDKGATEIVVIISKDSMLSSDNNLYFSVNSLIDIDVENDDNLFNSNYDEERQNYDSLGLFIAKELSMLMGGDLVAKNSKNGGVEFLATTSYIESSENKKSKSKNVKNKNIYLVESSSNASLTIKNMLVQQKHSVKSLAKNDFARNIPNFDEYDVAIIDEKLLSFKVIEALKASSVKVITLSNLFSSTQAYPTSSVANIELNKPLTHKLLAESINSLFDTENSADSQDISTQNTPISSTLRVYRERFLDAPNITLNSFSEFRGAEILVVEDNIINQKVIIGILGKSLANITVANDGQEALEILSMNKGKFDLVLMDINMPVMDGYTSSKTIRTISAFDNLPIVALSALTSPAEIEKMFNCGMNGYMAKPLKKEKLFSAMSMFLDAKEVQEHKEERVITELDGINIEKGIHQSNGSPIFYKEILKEFKDAYGDSAGVFEKLIVDFRHEQLKMLCVDMKGIAGSIGADDMQTLVTEVLQRIVFKKHELLPTFIKQFEKEMNRLNSSIDEYLAN